MTLYRIKVKFFNGATDTQISAFINSEAINVTDTSELRRYHLKRALDEREFIYVVSAPSRDSAVHTLLSANNGAVSHIDILGEVSYGL